MEKDGKLNIIKVWEQVQPKNLKNILQRKKLLCLNIMVKESDNAIDKVFNKM